MVIATYRTGDPLAGVVECLDAQTMPHDQFEAVFVDDGSPDDTLVRLRELAAQRPWMHVLQIENSGWPGRPRNVGVDHSRGEYVFFMDHDDFLFPDALRRMYDFAHEHDLDVLHPKEVVDGWNTPGWASWRHQSGHVAHFDQALLQCITPHKLYRRQFLLDNDVRFREGRVRLEDFDFNAKAWSRTDRIGVLAEYPCYRWVIHETNSHRAGYDVPAYWRDFTASVHPILAMPAGPRRDQLLVRWYRSRILQRVAEWSRYSPTYRATLRAIFAEQLATFPPELDALLNPADRARSALLRRDDVEGIQALSAADAGITLATRTSAMTWTGPALSVEVTAVVTTDDGSPLTVAIDGDRVHRVVDPTLADRLSEEERDLTDALAGAFGEVVVRARGSKVDWIVPTRSTVHVEPDPDDPATGRIVMRLTATIDPATAAHGAPLEHDVHDLFHRLEGPGWTTTHRIPGPPGLAAPALLSGLPAIAYTARNGYLALDLGGTARTTIGSAAPTPADFALAHDRTGVHIDLALPRIHVHGTTHLTGTAHVGTTEVPATLDADPTTPAHARFDLPTPPPGLHPIRLTLPNRRTGTLAQLRTTTPTPTIVTSTHHEPPPTTPTRLRQRLGRLLRRTPG